MCVLERQQNAQIAAVTAPLRAGAVTAADGSRNAASQATTSLEATWIPERMHNFYG